MLNKSTEMKNLKNLGVRVYKDTMILKEEKGCFEYQKKNDLMAIKSIEDRRVKDEIDEIKANVLKKDRHLFLK